MRNRKHHREHEDQLRYFMGLPIKKPIECYSMGLFGGNSESR